MRSTRLPVSEGLLATVAGLLCLATLPIHASHVDTVRIYSDAMQREITALVITPDSYATTDTTRYPVGRYPVGRYPVVYLLHGYSGNYLDWISKAPSLLPLADTHQTIIVCPDGGYNSWYLNSPVDDSSRYETHVGKEVVTFVDEHYRTIPDRAGRAISGLSMGGHGALFLALRHPDTFGAAGSMSGGVDLTYDTHAWEIAEKLGRYQEHPLRWDSLSVINLVSLYPPDSLAMIIDCGIDDFFFEINQHLHTTLLNKGIPHAYTVRPGAHNWNYWNHSVQYHLLFFKNFFDASKRTQLQGAHKLP